MLGTWEAAPSPTMCEIKKSETKKSVRNYECEECGKKFTTKDNLTTHTKAHSGVRPQRGSPPMRLPSPPGPPPSPTPPVSPSDPPPEEQSEGQITVEEELSNMMEIVQNMSLEDSPYLAKSPANKAAKTLICQVNRALQRLVPDSVSLTHLNQVTYAAGLYCVKKLYPDTDVSCRREQPRTPQPTPRWKQKQINIYRQELSQIKQHLRPPNEEGRLQK